MGPDQTPADVSAALASVRRRARLLSQAEGNWSWTDAVSLTIPAAIALYLVFTAETESWSLLGFVLLSSAIGGWQLRRLRTRVEALTKLLTEIGYPGDA